VLVWISSRSPGTRCGHPLDALIVRLAAAYQDPALLKFHLDDLGAAAGRAAALADRAQKVSTKDQVLTAGDYLDAYVIEWTLHHLDLIAHLPGATPPPAESLKTARQMLETIAGTPFPREWADADVLRVGTGRRAPTDEERAAISAVKLPLVLG